MGVGRVPGVIYTIVSRKEQLLATGEVKFVCREKNVLSHG